MFRFSLIRSSRGFFIKNTNLETIRINGEVFNRGLFPVRQINYLCCNENHKTIRKMFVFNFLKN